MPRPRNIILWGGLLFIFQLNVFGGVICRAPQGEEPKRKKKKKKVIVPLPYSIVALRLLCMADASFVTDFLGDSLLLFDLPKGDLPGIYIYILSYQPRGS